MDDNFILHQNSARNVGILVQATSAVVAFNSVRGPTCAGGPCTAPFATGVYAMHLTPASDLRILANTFSAPVAAYGAGDAVPAIVEHDASSGSLTVGAVVDNVFGWETSPETPVLLVAVVDSGNLVDSPRGGTPFDETAVNTSKGTIIAAGNRPQSPLYCADGMHGDPAGPQKNAAADISDSALSTGVARSLSDIDDAPRPLPSDSGADVITACN